MNRRTFIVGVSAAAAVGAVAPERVEAATITDAAGHEMPYLWHPANNPRRARTLVVLHGHGPHTTPSAPSAPGWNVLAPLDQYGPDAEGSWWLGEDGDFFTANLLHTLVRRKRRAIGGDAGLYFCGSSMGGYGSLLHGMLLGAKGVFANAFQSRLSGTMYTDNFPAIAAVGVPADSPYGDLRRYVRGKAYLPKFFLDFNEFDHEEVRYYAEHFVPFVAACKERGAWYRAKVYPIAEHTQVRPFADVLALFDRYR